jgi:hypothetical protein
MIDLRWIRLILSFVQSIDGAAEKFHAKNRISIVEALRLNTIAVVDIIPSICNLLLNIRTERRKRRHHFEFHRWQCQQWSVYFSMLAKIVRVDRWITCYMLWSLPIMKEKVFVSLLNWDLYMTSRVRRASNVCRLRAFIRLFLFFFFSLWLTFSISPAIREWLNAGFVESNE